MLWLLDFLKFLLYMIFYPRPGLFLKYARFEKFFKNFFFLMGNKKPAFLSRFYIL